MSIENADFVVQRNGQQLSCKGSDLKDKLQDADLMAVQRAGVTSCWEVEGASVTNLDQIQDGDLFACTDEDGVTKNVTGAQFKELFGPPPPVQLPWEGHDGGVWHVKNASQTVKLNGGPYTAWDVTYDGRKYTFGYEKQISQFAAGQELVFITPHNQESLFWKDGNHARWDFGELTDTSLVTTFKSMFRGCINFNSYIGDWDTSNVVDMEATFYEAIKFNQDISGWNMSNVRTVKWMLSGGYPPPTYLLGQHQFNQDISVWDTSKVENFAGMLMGCQNFQWPIGKWNTSSATDMNNMLYYTRFTQDLSGWDVSNVKSLDAIFAQGSANPTGIEGWDTSSVEDMRNLANNNRQFNRDISGWNTSKVREMDRAFESATGFNQDLSQWCVSLIPSMPNRFDYLCHDTWTKPKPVWGTCPRGEA